MAFAAVPDVTSAYEGQSPPLPSETRIETALAVVSARLRLLLPDLEDRIGTDIGGDLAILAQDVVVQATIRKLAPTGGQQVQSQTQQAGPFATTLRFTTDTSGTFPDDDLDLLRGTAVASSIGPIGTINVGRPDWYIP